MFISTDYYDPIDDHIVTSCLYGGTRLSQWRKYCNSKYFTKTSILNSLLEVNYYDGLPSGWFVETKDHKFYIGFEDEQSQNSFFDMLEHVDNIDWELKDLTDVARESGRKFFSYFIVKHN